MNNKISEIKGGVILSYLSLFVGNAISIVYTPIMIRMLGQSEYGLYNLVASFVSYLGLFSFGFDNTYLRYYTQYKETESEGKVASLNGMFLIVFSFIGALAGLCGMALRQYSDQIFGSNLTAAELDTAKTLMLLLVINIAITFPSNLFTIYINANEKFIFNKLVCMIKTVVNPFVVLPLLLMGYKSVALVSVTLCFSIIVLIVNIYYCFKKLNFRFRFSGFDFNVFRGIATFSFFVFLGEIVDEINWQLDKFLLGRFCGTAAVAIYGVASSLSMYYRQFSMAISNVFGPRINKIVATTNDNKTLTDVMIKVGRAQFIVLSVVAVGFLFCGREFCCLWAGYDYADSYLIAVALMIPSTIPLIQNVGISILTARNKHKFRSVAYTFIALGNAALSIPFCQIMQGLGCAIGTGISMIVGNGFVINWYYKKLGIDIGRFWRSIFLLAKGLIPMFFVGISLSSIVFDYSWIDLFLRIILLIIAFGVGMLLFGLNEEERKIVKNFCIKAKNKCLR